MTPTTHPRNEALPLPVKALGVLLLATVLGVALARGLGASPQQRADAATVSLRLLQFTDEAGGRIAVRDATSGQALLDVEPGENGFLRSAVRGLARERKRQGVGPEQPFELHARADGRLTLIDPATQRRIDLEAFGADNAAAFARLSAPWPSATPSRSP